ncbi:hypothetical protein A5696_09115 [Mycobacterium sp. E2699]|uniref:hypothetical protein n=1 Tax=Mycobacterium sp. E2699 TaxID=1834137 RepID=UPI0007FCA0FB|nr:hypothetical protein [Mycobacterium sp. E2699]OBH03243.1 hypothetical protein A5696_09115 [Mycobacterium sp. E2699]
MDSGNLESRRVTALEFGGLREHVDRGVSEMRGKFDAPAAGKRQIIDLLQTIVTDQGPNPPSD